MVVMALETDGTLRWIRTAGGERTDEALALAVTAADQVLVVGTFGGTVNFGGGARETTTESAAFIAAYSVDNVHLWDHFFGSMSTQTARSEAKGVVVGPADSTAVVGRFTGRVDFGSGQRVSTAADAFTPVSDAFVTRLAN